MTDLTWTRLYRPGARKAHLRQSGELAVACADPLELETLAEHDSWLGTGSQQEYETAAALPLCKDCIRFRDLKGGTRA